MLSVWRPKHGEVETLRDHRCSENKLQWHLAYHLKAIGDAYLPSLTIVLGLFHLQMQGFGLLRPCIVINVIRACRHGRHRHYYCM